MSARTYFGTDGIRGPYGGPIINETFVSRLGVAAGRWAGARSGGGRVLIGRDTRASGAVLSRALAAGLASEGLATVDLGVLPTPAVSQAVLREGGVLGAVITASHNPAFENGVKLFAPGGIKLSDDQESTIEGLLADCASPPPNGTAFPRGDALALYLAAVGSLVPRGSLSGWKVVLDTANGATHVSTPRVFSDLGATVSAIGDMPNGSNINDGLGSEHPQPMRERVVREGAVLGVAHDGDGDRCILCDETGTLLDGDEILTILATHALARGELRNGILVATVQSNLGVDRAVSAAGGRVLRTPVGDRYVAERMRTEGAVLGGETSGHIVCFDVGPTGDGLAAALKVAGVMLETGRPLSELRKALRRLPQAVSSIPVRSRIPIERLPRLSGEIAALSKELKGDGRVLVRYSGTEPRLRFLVEGPDQGTACAAIERLSAAAAADFGGGH